MENPTPEPSQPLQPAPSAAQPQATPEPTPKPFAEQPETPVQAAKPPKTTRKNPRQRKAPAKGKATPPTPKPKSAPASSKQSEALEKTAVHESEPAPSQETQPSGDPLMALAQAAKTARLSPADEDHATTLLKERLTGSRADVKTAIPAMTDGLSWIVCVNALSAAWETLTPATRRYILTSIGKVETEPARRLRLSIARGLFKIDPAAGLKAAIAAAAGLRDPETGALSAKHRQFFFNIFVGKGKPWVIQLPLASLKPAEAEPLLHAAIESFSFCPPFSQLCILRWIHDAGRFKKITAPDLATTAKSLARWNLKYQRQLKAEIPDLPAELEAALRPEALNPTAQPTRPTAPTETQPSPQPEPQPGKPEIQSAASAEEEPHALSENAPAPAEPATKAAQPQTAPEELIIPGRAERLAQKERAKERRHEKGRKTEPTEPRHPEKGRPEKSAAPFDLKETLRGLETYVTGLRNELETAKAQLHRQEKHREHPQRPEDTLPPEEAEALKRHNARLEATIAELHAQLEDLARNGEAVAESRQMYGEAPLPENGTEALKALLAIKLQDAFETYHAMRLEPLDKVFRLDYRDLLGSVFDYLLQQGVPLKKQTPKE